MRIAIYFSGGMRTLQKVAEMYRPRAQGLYADDARRAEGCCVMRRKISLKILLVLLTSTIATNATSPPVTLRGVVEGPGGTPIAEAQIVLADPNRGESKTISDQLGQFSFAGLASGSYVLTAKAPGFENTVIPIRIGSAPVPGQRIRMKIAAVVQEITVTAAMVDPVAADGNMSGIQAENDLLKSLPVRDGDPLATVALFVDPSANGVEGTQILVDGVETNELDVPSSSVKSVAVNRNPYSAEFGRPGKGRIEVTSRPGSTHRIHHHAIVTLRNSSLDAKNAFAKVRPAMQRQLYELEMDGPLPHDRGTFYLGGDHLHDNESAIVNATPPGGQLIQNVSVPQRTTRGMGRLDFRFTPVQTLSLRFNFNRNSMENQGVGGFDLPERAFNAHTHINDARVFEIATPTPNFRNEFRFVFRNKVTDAFGISNAAAIVVPGAYHAGGAQVADRERERVVEFQDVASVIKGRHSWRLGAGVRRRDFDIFDASNFGGTYTLSRPGWFAINVGNPNLVFHMTDYFYFAQDEVRLAPNLDLMVGLRHEMQSNLYYNKNLAPRIGLSYAPRSGNTVFRAGAGIFYDRMPWRMQEETLFYDAATHIRQILVEDPTFPQPLPGVLRPSVVQIAPRSRIPCAVQASLAVEHKLATTSFVSAEYTLLRGTHLYRTRDINAPLTSTGLRPNPNFTNVDQFEAASDSHTQSLSISFRTAVRKRLELLSQYTFSRSYDNTSGMSWHPADNYNLTGEYGRSDFDRRHRLNVAAIVYLPGSLKLGTIAQVSSGIPYNITTGLDNDHDTVYNDRPFGVSRNTGRGPGFAEMDLRLSRRFVFGRDKKSPYAEFRFDAFNVLNHVNATNYVGVETSTFFGRANSAYPGRQLQVSTRLGF
jgi:hypothetical protein